MPEPDNPQALNRYSYGYNNPVAYTDPTGHTPCYFYCGGGDYSYNSSYDSLYDSSYSFGSVSSSLDWYQSTGDPYNIGLNLGSSSNSNSPFTLGGSNGFLSPNSSSWGSSLLGATPDFLGGSSIGGEWGGLNISSGGVDSLAANLNENNTWGSYLPGTAAGESAAQFWADISVNSNHPLAPLAVVPGVISSLWTPDTAVDTTLTLAGGWAAKGAAWAMGPVKQWVRFGESFSYHLGQTTKISIRWGASPIGNGKYLKQIPSVTMQRFNQWLRGLKLPGSSWRTKDPGHFHIKK